MDVDNGFEDLLQQAEQLTAGIDSNGELPRVERNLHQILQGGEQLWSKVSQTTRRDTADVKASLLLGSKGFDLPKISSKLEYLSVAQTYEPLEPIREHDVQGFLKNERENSILSVIEESRKATFDRVDQLHWRSLEGEWEVEKQKILTALVGLGQDLPGFTLEAEPTFSEKINMKTRSSLDNVEIAYARQIYAYNESVIQGGNKLSLVARFTDVASKLNDQKVVDMWSMVASMINLPLHTAATDIGAARSSPLVQATIIAQSRKYLEDSYIKYLKALVYDNLQQAQLGGVPGVYHLVKSFLNIRLPSGFPGMEDGLVDGHPVWAMVYYCLRCGDFKAALQVTHKAGPVLEDFQQYLQECASSDDLRLSPNSENTVRLKYKRNIRTSSDPFKKIVYSLIGSCDVVDDHPEVADKLDDYLWLRVCQLRPEDESRGLQLANDRLSLNQLQTKLLEEYGESHFSAMQQPLLYFQVLFLTGQFEAAIEFLSRVEVLRCHAVHVALALYDINLLSLPQTIHSQLLSRETSDKPPSYRLNFARLLLMYTRKFRVTDTREAIQYFYFLRNVKGVRGENMFMASVSELALETREFDMLLGKLEADGCRSPGLIDRFHGDTSKLTELVAADSESKGLCEDAVKLYDLAGKHEKVLKLLTLLMSQIVTQPSTPQSRRDMLQTLAINIAERYRSQGLCEDRETVGNFHLLLDVMTFFDQYHAKNYKEALDVIQRLQLVPLQADDVERKVNTFKLLTEEIRRNIPDILLAIMSILYAQYRETKSTIASSPILIGRKQVVEDGGKDNIISYLRKQAKTLITFTGRIPYRMPGDTNARLVQMEVLMN